MAHRSGRSTIRVRDGEPQVAQSSAGRSAIRIRDQPAETTERAPRSAVVPRTIVPRSVTTTDSSPSTVPVVDTPVRYSARGARIKPSAPVADPHERERVAQCVQHAADEPMVSPIIAVIVPVLGRPAHVQPLVKSFMEATPAKDARLYFVAQRSDAAELEAIGNADWLDETILVDDIDRSWARKINRGFERTTEPWMLLGADDLRFHDGWVDLIRDLLRTHAGVIGTNDLGNPNTMAGTTSTHPLVRRSYAKICGTIDERSRVVHEGYDHNYPDTELVATAKRRGLYVHRLDCVIEHMHPAWGKGTEDPIYVLGQRNMARDAALFQQRARRFGLQ